jgi:GTP cyclohydrolase IA
MASFGTKAPDLALAARCIDDFLDALGVDRSSDPELDRTGERVAEAFANDLLAGYALDPHTVLSERIPHTGSSLVVVASIQTVVMCPHHLLPAPGVVHVGYAPSETVVGLGSVARLVQCFSQRLVLQETLAQQIADALVTILGARGAGCVARLSPTCLTARGERKHGAEVVTVATAGTFQHDATARAEFLAVLPGFAPPT